MKYRCDWAQGTACVRCAAQDLPCQQTTKKQQRRPSQQLIRQRDDNDQIRSLEQTVETLQSLIASLKVDNTPDVGTLTELFNYSRFTLLPSIHIIVIPEHKTYAQVLAERPLLHSAMIATAARMTAHEAADQLYKDCDRAVLKAQVEGKTRNLDLLQSLHVLSTWYPCFDRPSIMKASTYVSLGLDVATDIVMEDSWDILELDRCLIQTHLAMNSLRMWQSLPTVYELSRSMVLSKTRLAASACESDKSLARMTELMDLARPYLDGVINRTNVAEYILKIDRFSVRDFTGDFSLRYMEMMGVGLMLLKWSASPEFDKIEDGALLIPLLQDYLDRHCSLTDEFLLQPLNGMPSLVLLRPLLALVHLRGISLQLPNLGMDEYAQRIRQKLEIMALTSTFATQLPAIADRLEHYFLPGAGRPKSLLEVLVESPISPPISSPSVQTSTAASLQPDGLSPFDWSYFEEDVVNEYK